MSDASLCPVVMVVVSNANLGNPPIKPKMVVRTAFWTLGCACDVNLEMRSDGDNLETTAMYGLRATTSSEGDPGSNSSPGLLLLLPGPTSADDKDGSFVVWEDEDLLSSSSSSVLFSIMSKDIGKLFSLIYSRAFCILSDSS